MRLEHGKTLTELNIIGCGGHSRSVADVILRVFPKCELFFYDDLAKDDERVMGKYPVKLLKEISLDKRKSYFIAVGDNYKREKIFCEYENYDLISIISNNSYISDTAIIGSGCFVGDLSHVGPEVNVGDNSIVNTGAIVEHESYIGNSSHISVGARICGRTRIGDRVFLGAGATVIDRITICNDVIIGAGAVVISDICSPGTYVGVPAIKVKE